MWVNAGHELGIVELGNRLGRRLLGGAGDRPLTLNKHNLYNFIMYRANQHNKIFFTEIWLTRFSLNIVRDKLASNWLKSSKICIAETAF